MPGSRVPGPAHPPLWNGDRHAVTPPTKEGSQHASVRRSLLASTSYVLASLRALHVDPQLLSARPHTKNPSPPNPKTPSPTARTPLTRTALSEMPIPDWVLVVRCYRRQLRPRPLTWVTRLVLAFGAYGLGTRTCTQVPTTKRLASASANPKQPPYFSSAAASGTRHT